MSFLLANYMATSHIKNLNSYKYHGEDKSIFANTIMQPFWRKFVLLLPLSLAPNLITLIGFIAIVVQYIFFFHYCPQLECVNQPSWIYPFAAFCVFFYQTLDAVDGKQARRTGSSSPLGELFDHGCDASSLAMLTLSTVSAFDIGTSDWTALWVANWSLFAFYFAQWEEYITGSLILGYINVTEAQFLVMAIQMVTYSYGTGIWSTPLIDSIPYSKLELLVVVQTLIIGFTILTNIQAVLKRSFSHVLYLIPGISLWTSACLWAFLSPSLYQTYPHYFIMFMGLLNSNIVGRMVSARVTSNHFSYFQPIILPSIFGFLNAAYSHHFDVAPLLDEVLLLKVTFWFSIFSYLHFGVSLIQQITEFLGIKCFTITPKQVDGKNN